MLAGLRYAAGRRDLLGSYLVDINAMFFGMPMALFPQIATGFGGPVVLGLMYTAPSVGSLLATLTSGWTRFKYVTTDARLHSPLRVGGPRSGHGRTSTELDGE